MAVAGARFDRLLWRKGRPALIYGTDGAGPPRETRAAVIDTGNVRMLGTTRGDLLRAHLPGTTPVAPGQVLVVPGLSPMTYLVVKRLIATPFGFDPGVMLALFALPLALRVQRAVRPPSSALGGYDEPATRPGSGSPDLLIEETAIAAGFSNQYDPLNETQLGPLPAGLLTAYCAPDVRVVQGDTLLDGSRAHVVQQTGVLLANGQPYARQLILAQSAGPGWPTQA